MQKHNKNFQSANDIFLNLVCMETLYDVVLKNKHKRTAHIKKKYILASQISYEVQQLAIVKFSNREKSPLFPFRTFNRKIRI